MSDEPVMLNETPPIMSAEHARGVARHYKGFADPMRRLASRRRVYAGGQSIWWMTYSVALAQTKSE